jgi:hypothetical protein
MELLPTEATLQPRSLTDTLLIKHEERDDSGSKLVVLSSAIHAQTRRTNWLNRPCVASDSEINHSSPR